MLTGSSEVHPFCERLLCPLKFYPLRGFQEFLGNAYDEKAIQGFKNILHPKQTFGSTSRELLEESSHAHACCLTWVGREGSKLGYLCG